MKVYSWKTLIATILIVFAGISYRFIPSQKWIAIILLIIGLVYNIMVGILVRKHVKRKYFL